LIRFLAFYGSKVTPKKYKFGKKSIFSFLPNFSQCVTFFNQNCGKPRCSEYKMATVLFSYCKESLHTLSLTLHAFLAYVESLLVFDIELSFVKLSVKLKGNR